MFKKSKKQKKFSKEYALNENGEGGFILRITEKRVDIETLVKDWKISFSRETYEYGYIFHLLKSEEFKSLHMIAVAIFLTRFFFRDAEMIQAMFEIADESSNRISEKQPAPEQSDEEIIAEQEVIHEQTLESIENLENVLIKKETHNG